MSYIQGTQVKLKGRFFDLETDQQTTVTEVILTIEDPTGAAIQYTLSAGQVQEDVTDPADPFYFYVLDTMPLPGPWKYQFESTGNEKVVGIKQINVRPRLAA